MCIRDSDVAAQAALADHIDRPARFQFRETLPQLIYGDVQKAVNMPRGIFPYCTGIQQRHAAIPGQVCNILPVKDVYKRQSSYSSSRTF